MPQSARLAVFVSGGGSNLQALIDHFHGPVDSRARVELVVASRPGIGALDRAAKAGVPVLVMGGTGNEGDADALLSALEEHRIGLIVLAGYIRLVPVRVVDLYADRMINIHPALLPAFGGHGMYGQRVHRAVLSSGARVSGATVHMVTDRYDEGRIIAQWPVPVLSTDTPETLAARVLQVEHLLLPAAVEQLLSKASAIPTAQATAVTADPLEGSAAFTLIDGDPAPVSLMRLNSSS